MIIIYTLTDPRDGLIKYVGKTKNSLIRRLQCHESDARSRKTRNPNINWIKSLLSDGFHPIIEEIEKVDDAEWEHSEMFWIGQLKAWGFELKNMTIGGDRGGDWTGKHHSIETKAKIGKANEGSKNGFFGKTHSPEHKKKLSLLAKNNKGRKMSEAAINKLKNHVRSEDHKRNLSLSLLNNPKLTKKIYQYSMDGKQVAIWDSMKLAAESMGKDSSPIVAVCKGKRKTAYGYVWSYV